MTFLQPWFLGFAFKISENGKSLPRGEIGEVLVKSPLGMVNYLQQSCKKHLQFIGSVDSVHRWLWDEIIFKYRDFFELGCFSGFITLISTRKISPLRNGFPSVIADTSEKTTAYTLSAESKVNYVSFLRDSR